MYALFSALLAALVVLVLYLTETVTNWWLLGIGLASWLGIFFVLKILKGRAEGKSVGEAAATAFDGIGDVFGGDGASCGSGGCGSGGGD